MTYILALQVHSEDHRMQEKSYERASFVSWGLVVNIPVSKPEDIVCCSWKTIARELVELINNVNKTLREDLTAQIKTGSRLSIAASCFSIYAFQELKEALKDIKELRFIFTSPTFTTEKTPKQ